MSDENKPSIAELQRLCRDEQANHDADLASAVPALLETIQTLERENSRLGDLVTEFRQACVPNCHDYDPSTKGPADVERLRTERDRLLERRGQLLELVAKLTREMPDE